MQRHRREQQAAGSGRERSVKVPPMDGCALLFIDTACRPRKICMRSPPLRQFAVTVPSCFECRAMAWLSKEWAHFAAGSLSIGVIYWLEFIRHFAWMGSAGVGSIHRHHGAAPVRMGVCMGR